MEYLYPIKTRFCGPDREMCSYLLRAWMPFSTVENGWMRSTDSLIGGTPPAQFVWSHIDSCYPFIMRHPPTPFLTIQFNGLVCCGCCFLPRCTSLKQPTHRPLREYSASRTPFFSHGKKWKGNTRIVSQSYLPSTFLEMSAHSSA